MPPLREEAETLRLGLLMGLVEPEEVVAWADRVIIELAAPPIEVIDIAMASRQPADEVARLLARVPGPADFTAAAHRALGILQERFLAGNLPLEVVADMLYVYSTAAKIPEAERQMAAIFIDEYYLSSYYGTIEFSGLRNEIGRFLAEHTAGFRADT